MDTTSTSLDLSKLEEIPMNPLYLHPNRSPSLQLTSTVFIGNNFHSWSKLMKMGLISKNKLKFVDDFMLVPSREILYMEHGSHAI